MNCSESRAKSDVKSVHAVCNAVIARHCEPLVEVRNTCKNTPGYGEFNSSGKDPNPIFDPVSTLDNLPEGPGSFSCLRDPGAVMFAIEIHEEFDGLDGRYVSNGDSNWFEPGGYSERELTGLCDRPTGGV